LHGFGGFDPHTLKRLTFGKCFPATDAAIPLHKPVAILKMTETLGFALTTITIIQLAFPGNVNYR
jgi:hypothetical protein